ncbi:MAG: S41 family peptidase [Bellilinea sp.]|jgi:carboxyl-terminal processing protease
MERNIKPPPWVVILTIVGFILLVGISFLAGYWFNDHQSLFFPSHYPLLDQAYRLLEQYGLSPLPEQAIIEHGLIRGLLQVYNDPHTVLVEPPQHELQSNQLHGKFGGIGARIEQDADNRYRLYPFPDSPAKKAGVMDGDILIRVDEVDILADTTREVVLAELRGDKGTQVVISVLRQPDNIEKTFTIIREDIPLPSVTWNLTSEDPSVGLIQINLIAATTADEVSSAIHDLTKQGARFFILDLRNNSGGLVDAGVNIARLFLRQGEAILEQQYRDKPVQTLSAERDGEFIDLPFTVLINNNTASAAEIVAGALKAHQRAVVIGMPSYGKDSIQLVFDLQDGSSLHITSARWSVPDLEPPIKDHGVLPDIWIDNKPVESLNARYLQSALEVFNRQPSPQP